MSDIEISNLKREFGPNGPIWGKKKEKKEKDKQVSLIGIIKAVAQPFMPGSPFLLYFDPSSVENKTLDQTIDLASGSDNISGIGSYNMMYVSHPS